MGNGGRGGDPFFQTEQHGGAMGLAIPALLSASQHLVDGGSVEPVLTREIGNALAFTVQRGPGLLGCTDSGHSSQRFKYV
jgi:hypothetical protein